MENQPIPEARPIETPPAQPNPQAPGQGASGRAIAALILGILSLICMGFLSGIPAIILGQMEMRAIKAGTSPVAGESAAKVGFVLGIVGTALTCLTLMGILFMVILGISVGGMEAAKTVALII